MKHEWAIGIFTTAAIVALNLGCPAGSLLGLLSSPSWIVTTWRARDWGKFTVSIVCSLAYVAGCIKWLAE